ncbi:MAG: adenine-specific methyltransferase EcoRI family protein [Chitinispirillales bacterium]|jgi:hypothetical protein|nr:adenine-specific methyltransferase EcoRI family protein [Chitinispirillales bacterium]
MTLTKLHNERSKSSPVKITDYIHCESTDKTIEIHRGRNGYNWAGQKGKILEWTIPVLVEKSADEILEKIYSCSEWQTYGKGRETSIDSPALRDIIWNNIQPYMDIKSMKSVPKTGDSKSAMVRTQTKGKYIIETKRDIITIGSNECYTFYQSVAFVVEWFVKNVDKDYFRNKVVYLNADDTKSAFWLYFYNNFNKLGLKKLIATHYDGTGLSYGNSETNIKSIGIWEEYAGYIMEYEGKIIRRVPPIGVKSDFHGDFKEKICMDIARNKADIIMTNPPFGQEWKNYINAMLSTGKKLIFWGNGGAPLYNWFMPLLNSKKIQIVKDCSDTFLIGHYMTPTMWRKKITTFIYTSENISWQKPDKDHYSAKSEMLSNGTAWYDDNEMLCCDNAMVPIDTNEILAVSTTIFKHGILNAGYHIFDYHRYQPYKNGKHIFSRILIKKEQI